MEKVFKKTMIAIACGALVASCGIALMEHRVSEAKAEAQDENQIVLNAGQGELEQTFVTLAEDGTLPELPVPTRAGWEFVGWFDKEVVENFWGDEAYESVDSTVDYKTLKETYSRANGYQYVLYEGKATPVAELGEDADRGWKELTFNWICATRGNQAHAGETFEGENNTLYAMYRAERYTVYFHLNGWLNTYEASATSSTAHRALPEHGGYFVDYELDQFPSLKWENHTFLGWYLDPACTEEYSFRQVGAYKINETALTHDLHLYAKWEASAPFDGVIRVNKPSNLLEPKLGETFSVRCVYTLGASRDMPVITRWESSEPGLVEFVSCGVTDALFRVVNADAFKNGNREITIYVTVDGERYLAAELTLGHSWGRAVSEKLPTCTEAGQVVYGCKFCNETKVVSYAANGHRFTQITHPATCTEDATVETYCIVCGLRETNVLENSKLGHHWSYQTIANCNGTKVIATCTACALTETTFDADAVMHDWDLQYTVDRAATCAAEGEKSIHCRACDAKKAVTAIPVTEAHEWGEWSVEREATATESGILSRACKVCGKTETQDIPVIPEVEPELPEVEEPEVEPELPETEEPEVEPELPEVEEPEVEPELPETEEPEVEPELPEVEEPEVEPELPEADEVVQEKSEEVAVANSSAASHHISAAQVEAQNGASVKAWVYVLAGVSAALICIGAAVVVLLCRNKNRK